MPYALFLHQPAVILHDSGKYLLCYESVGTRVPRQSQASNINEGMLVKTNRFPQTANSAQTTLLKLFFYL